jgi:hypothetical protein
MRSNGGSVTSISSIALEFGSICACDAPELSSALVFVSELPIAGEGPAPARTGGKDEELAEEEEDVVASLLMCSVKSGKKPLARRWT